MKIIAFLIIGIVGFFIGYFFKIFLNKLDDETKDLKNRYKSRY